MKDNLKDLLQERFSAHEAPVEPGAWDAIASNLAVANGEVLRQALQHKFSGHEVPVDAGVWSNISNQMGHGAAGGTGIAAGWMAAGVSAVLVAGGLLWYTNSSSSSEGPKPAQVAAPVTTENTLAANVVAEQAADIPSTTPANVPAKPVASQMSAQEQPAGRSVSPAKGHSAEAQSTKGNEPPPPPQVSGEGLVTAVLQQEIANIVADPKTPEPDKHEVIAPPTQNEMPKTGVTAVEHAPAASGDDAPEEGTQPDNGFSAEPVILIPNVFTPNDDGVNDKFIVTTNVPLEQVRVRVFSAKSEALVFTSDGLENSWGGRDLRGVPCEDGFYFYAIEVVGKDGRTYAKGETIRLNRPIR